MPISPSDFEVVDETSKGPNWEDFEAVPDPKALAFGVSESIAEPARLMGVFRQPAVGLASQMGRQQGPVIRRRDLEIQAQRAAAAAGGGEVSPVTALAPTPTPEELRPSIRGPEPGQQIADLIGRVPLVGPALQRAVEPTTLPYETRQQAGVEAPPETALQAFQIGSRNVIAPFLKPEQMALAVAAGGAGEVAPILGRAVSAYFGAEAGKGVVEAMPRLAAAKTDAEKIQILTEVLGGTVLAAMMGSHAVKAGPDFPRARATGELAGPPTPGVMLQTPRGAPAPRLELPGIERATPEEAAARAEQMTREATAGFGPRGLPEPMGPRLPRLALPEGPSDPRVQELRDQGIRTIGEILNKYPELKGNREAARALRNDAFPEMRKVTDATRIQREPEHIGAPPGPEIPSEPTEVRPAEGEPDRDRGGVLRGEEGEAPIPPKVEGEEPPPTAAEPVPLPPKPPTPAPAEAPAAPPAAAPAVDELQGERPPIVPKAPTTPPEGVHGFIQALQDPSLVLDNRHSDAAALAVKTPEDLDSLLTIKKHFDAIRDRFMRKASVTKDPKEQQGWLEEAFRAGQNGKLAKEAIEAATNTGSHIEDPSKPSPRNIGPRPVDVRKDAAAAKWFRDNARDHGITIPDDILKEESPKAAEPAKAEEDLTPDKKHFATFSRLETERGDLMNRIEAAKVERTRLAHRVSNYTGNMRKALQEKEREALAKIDALEKQLKAVEAEKAKLASERQVESYDFEQYIKHGLPLPADREANYPTTKPAEGFDMGAASKEAKANYDKAIKAAEGSEAVEMTSPSFPGLRVLITKDPSEPGKWRATRVDEKGPSGHTVYDSKEKAIADYTGGHGMGAAFGWDFTVSEARKPTAAAAPAEPKGPEFSKAEEEDLAAAWRSAKDASELSPLHQSMFRVKRAKTAFRELGKWAEQKDAAARARWQAAKAELEAASAEYAKQKEIAKQAKTPVAETKPAISATPPADVESMLKAEVPDVTEQKARVKAVETRTRELKKELDSLTPKIKELEGKIKYQRGTVYQRSRIKAGARASDVAEYRKLNAQQDDLGRQIRALEDASRADRDAIDKAESSKIISDKARPLLQRLDHAARVPGASPEIIKARDAETYRLLKEKHPDITDAEMLRLAPEVQREAYFGGDFMQRIPAVRNLRQAALDAAVNAPDSISHLFPQELRDKIDRMRESRTIGTKELEDIKKEIKDTSTKIREDLAAQEKKAAEEKAAEEAKSAQLMAEAQAQADSAKRSGTKGGRSPKEIRTELVSRIKGEIDKLIESKNVKVSEPQPDYIHAEAESGLVATGLIERTGAGKFKVRVQQGPEKVDLTFDTREDAIWAVKAAASEGTGKAIIGIPGDGVFRLNKRGLNLLKVMEDARKIDVTRGGGEAPYKSTGGAKAPPSSIKTFADWREAKEYHGLEDTDRIYDWSPALRVVAEKVNPERPEMVTAGDVDAYLKAKKETKATAPGGGIPEFEKPGIADKVVSKLESAAEEARKRLKSKEGGITFGAGPLHELPNIRDYAIIGAAKLARYGLDKARFAAEMIDEFGKRIGPHIDRIFEEARVLFTRHAEIEKNKATPVQQIISQSIGEGKPKADTIHQIIDSLQTGLRTVRALKDHFTDAPHVSRAEVKVADDFLEADANRIRESLGELVKKELPVSERGRFLTAIANATKRSPILTGDPEAMYRRAAEVAARIEDRAVEVKKNDAINAIKDNVTKALASPTVDLRFKSKIGDLVQRFAFAKPTEQTLTRLRNIRDYIASEEALGHNVEMPKAILESLEILNKTPIKDLPLHVLEAMRDRIALLEEMGRRTVATRQQRWENEKAVKNRELVDEESNPIEKRPEFRAGIGETTSPTMKLRNWINRRLDGAAMVDKALLPIDALFDLLGDAKGAYKGWLFKHIRNPIDLGFNAAQVMRDRITKPLEDIIKRNNLNEQNAERIGAFAAMQQEGGRERLLAMGATPADLARIESTLTPAERSAYNSMREALDQLLPQVQKLMHELYNVSVEPVANYFPMPRDWSKVEIEPKTPAEPKFGEERTFDDLAGWKDLYGDYTPRTTKTERGFTIERKPGAESAIKINAFDVFGQHINDVAYLLSTQRDIKMIGELAKGDLFVEKYGKIGQSMVLNWLDTVARQGKLGGFRRWDMLDALRKNTSAGVIGFRLASQFVHLSNIPLAMERTGTINYASGLRAAMTEEGEKFLRENFAETFARGGGEPALAEAMAEGSTIFGKQVVPKKWVKTGFAIARMIDQKNSQATVLGMYFRALKEKGIDPSTYTDIPIDKEAQARALVMARRAVASPLPKDVPMALSRGALTGGNISIGRAAFQFQNIFLDQWSNIRHDLARAGIREGNPVKAVRMAFALTVMIAAETSIREASKEIIKGATGFKPKKELPTTSKVAVEVLRRFPFMGQITAGVLYGETGVPLIDSALQVPREVYRAATAKHAKAQDKAAIRAVAGAAQLGGIPGASQLGELIEKAQ